MRPRLARIGRTDNLVEKAAKAPLLAGAPGVAELTEERRVLHRGVALQFIPDVTTHLVVRRRNATVLWGLWLHCGQLLGPRTKGRSSEPAARMYLFKGPPQQAGIQ